MLRIRHVSVAVKRFQIAHCLLHCPYSPCCSFTTHRTLLPAPAFYRPPCSGNNCTQLDINCIHCSFAARSVLNVSAEIILRTARLSIHAVEYLHPLSIYQSIHPSVAHIGVCSVFAAAAAAACRQIMRKCCKCLIRVRAPNQFGNLALLRLRLCAPQKWACLCYWQQWQQQHDNRKHNNFGQLSLACATDNQPDSSGPEVKVRKS